MNKISMYMRHPLKNLSIISNQFLQIRLKTDEKASGNKDSKEVSDKAKNEEALKKLNLLLKQIVENDTVTNKTSSIELAKPKGRKDIKQESKIESVNGRLTEKNITNSVKNVAASLGGNVTKTESELLSKLLSPINESTVDKKQVISTNLSDIVKGMKIDRTTKSAEDLSRAQQVRDILQVMKGSGSSGPRESRSPRKYQGDVRRIEYREREKIDLFGKEPLGIFPDVSQFTEECVNKTWQVLHERELRLATTHPPSNYFQQMILWTDQGKLWKFPIDNEQGMEAEKEVYFADHVFLEKHLEPWCPAKGPVRHFMELVCVGLSKNPYMSVKHKQEHIAWFKDYFQDKQKLLEEVGAVPQGHTMKNEDMTKDI